MKDIYQGDPKIRISEEGAEINFPGDGGQPEMEQGVENLAVLSLFTKEGWAGNYFIKDLNKKIGSKYEETLEKPITLSNIELMRQSTIKALDNPAFGEVQATITIPASSIISNVISISPPGKDIDTIILEKNGVNWTIQADKEQGE